MRRRPLSVSQRRQNTNQLFIEQVAGRHEEHRNNQCRQQRDRDLQGIPGHHDQPAGKNWLTNNHFLRRYGACRSRVAS